MRKSELPPRTDLILLGGGHSHLFVLERLAMRPPPATRITLVTRDLHTPYSGMLPGYVAGHYAFDDAHIDLLPLARRAGARVIHAEACGLDADRRQLAIAGRPPLGYDLLSINIGSRPTFAAEVEADPRQFAVKPVDRFIEAWQRLECRLRDDAGEIRVAIVGAGAGGVELALALDHRARHLDGRRGQLRIVLCNDREQILASHNPRVRRIFERILRQRGIELRHRFRALEFGDAELRDESGHAIAADAVIWVTHASPAPWLRESGLELDDAGFVRVAPTLQSLSHAEVFAAGDIAAVAGYPRPKSGVFAVRQGLPLARNLRRVVEGRSPLEFRPQRQFLSLISTGDRYAVASRGRWAFAGRWWWRLKDRIDRKFVRRFGELPPMAGDDEAAPDLAPMRCGGCGSKLGSGILEPVLTRIADETGLDLRGGFAYADDAALVKVPEGAALIQTVDHFSSFVDDPYTFGRIAANHALGDLYAMGVPPHSALVSVSVAFGGERQQADDLYLLLSGIVATLRANETRLLGGHSGEAAQMSCGLSVNGFAEPLMLWRKSGLEPGDALLLTKPLGSGMLFAADMRGRARGDWIDRALASMLQGNREAMRRLRRFDVRACTDVTGFGLAGHLFEMARASGVAAEVVLPALPLLAGAAELAATGLVSSLQPQNLRLRHQIDDPAGLAADPRYPLLFDPQTAGGLLAGVPAAQAAEAVATLRAAGFTQATVVARAVAAESPDWSLRLVSA